MLAEVLSKIKAENPKKIAVQLPDGLRRKEEQIREELEENLKVEIVFLEGSNFGACDLRDKEAKELGCDLLLHVGHSDFGLESVIPVVYAEIQSDLEIEKIVRKASEEIEENRIGLITTLQHIQGLEKAKEILKNSGKEVFTAKPTKHAKYEAQILGCDSTAGTLLEDKVDCFLYLGTGNFHPLPVALATAKKIYIADPELNQVRELTELKEKVLGQIKDKIEKAKKAQNFGIIVSTKPGQNKRELAEELKGRIESNGKQAEILIYDTIDYQELNGLEFDAYVNTACPRISLDDMEAFNVPVLSVSELESVLSDNYAK